MEKLLLEISCPSTAKKYDFWISKKMLVGEVREKIISEIRDYEKNPRLLQQSNQIILVRSNGILLDNLKMTMEQTGVQSGECLMII